MRRLVPATVVGLVLLMASHAATALGLGRVSTQSYLGNPLEFTIALSAQSSDALSSDCIAAEVYAGDSRVPAEMVRVRVNRGSDGTPTSLRVLTGTRIDEPVASVELTLDCGTRVTRKYVVFVDPPLLNLAQSGSGDSAVSTGVAPRSPSSARELAPSTAPRRARSTRSSNASGTVQAGGTGAASAAREQRRAARAAAARTARAAAPTAERGSRLKLESAPAIVAGAPVKEKPAAATAGAVAAAGAGAGLAAKSAAAPLPAASGASGVATAASGAGGLIADLVAKAEADALALNAERLRALEERMNRLRTDNQSLQKSMLDLQTRLAEAEATRYANPLVYALAAGLLLLLLAVIALLWRQASLRKESEWLKAAAADAGGAEPRGDARPAARSVVTPSARPSPAAVLAAGAASVTAAGVALRGSADQTAPSAALRAGAPPVDAEDGAGVVAEAPATAATPPVVAAGPHESTSVHDPRREVTVEELIDLEQQADFFVVLGQDDAAIDLLMGHVQGTGGASPLPYLKLLEIHRRRDEREAYDRVRERFNRRFSAFAPEWDAHTGHDRALEDYPSVIERLQGLWPKPTQAMDALAALLFQRDLTAQTFDLPAYGELLFLYSLARELAEHEPPPDGVDLLLPLDDGGPGPQLPGGGGAKLAAGAAAAGGLALVASDLPALDPFPGSGLPDLPDSPTALPATYPVPLAFGTPEGGGGLDDGLLDLNISDDPEEPKGPLSKY